MAISKYKLFWFSGWVYDFTKVATFFIVIFLIINYFFYTIFIVSGASMETTLVDGDFMLINRYIYHSSKVKRGDIVALYFPGEEEKKFVKRIIGLPGEKISIKDGQVIIDGNLIEESYLEQKTTPDMIVDLGKNEFFVLGDNRQASSDSRTWGPLDKHYIIGKAEYRIINKSNIKKLSPFD